MIYLQLSSPYRDYQKLKISMIQFMSEPKILFTYQIYKANGILTEQYITITNEADINKIKNSTCPGHTPYDSICRSLIQYVIDSGIEAGTIEVG
jgi:hypothetical protein